MKLRNALLAVVLATGAGSGVAIGVAQTARAATTTGTWSATATQAVPTLKGATEIGALPGTAAIAVTVGLRLRGEATLQSFIADTATPSSPTFGAYYTTAHAFTATYGPSSTSVAAVTSYLEAQGFTNVTVSPNNLLVTASGTAAEAEQAFHTALTEFAVGGARVYANTEAAMVPSNLAGIVAGVLGLNDAFKASPIPVKAGSQTTTVPNVVDEYSPQGFQKAYEATAAATGSETAIATISSANMTRVIANLRAEEEANGLPKVPVTVEYAGLANPTTTPTDNVEWDLDSQFATGIAQTVSHFYFYDATSLATATLALVFNEWASQDVAKAASASLGECEVEPYLSGAMIIDDEIFAEAAAQGQTMFASSGDTGASCAVESTNGVPDSGPPMVNYFASSAYVVGVGGTTLTTKSTGSYDFETSWVAGGGGLSQFENRPYWQAKVMPVTDGKTGDRGVPDLAMDANPTTGANVYVQTTGGKFEGVGGTSLSSPLALGVWARIESTYHNQLGFAAPVLYGVYLKGVCNTTVAAVEQICSTLALHAPIAGDNGLYPETPGYNYDTGLGTFDTAAMVTAVKPFVPQRKKPRGPTTDAGAPAISVTPTTASVHYGSETQQSFTLTVAGTAGDGSPEGAVSLETGTTTVCTATLTASTAPDSSATCTPVTGHVLASGTYRLTARYTPATPSSTTRSFAYDPSSKSTATTLTVEPATAGRPTISVTPATATVQYGSETSQTFTVTVTGTRRDGSPEGTVSLETGTTTVCTATLTPAASAASSATCTPTTGYVLGSGTHSLTASFAPGAPSSSTRNFEYQANTESAATTLTVEG